MPELSDELRLAFSELAGTASEGLLVMSVAVGPRVMADRDVRKLREGDRLLNEARMSPRWCATSRSPRGVTESTWNRWRAHDGGMKADEAKRLRQVETNARLKK